MPNFLSLEQVAKKLFTSVSGVKKMIKEKRLEAVRINANTVVVDEDALTRIKSAPEPKGNPKGLESLKAYHAKNRVEKEKAAKKAAAPKPSSAPKQNGKAPEKEPVAAN